MAVAVVPVPDVAREALADIEASPEVASYALVGIAAVPDVEGTGMLQYF